MKKGEEYTADVESLSYPNKGTARIVETGDTVSVKNVIPGQRIRLRVTKKRGGRAEGRSLEVLSPSPAETRKEVCPHFPLCGGCQYQTLPYEEQLQLKKTQVRGLLVPVIGEERWRACFEGALASPLRTEYRNKMEFSFGDDVPGGPLTLGLHCRGSIYDIATVSECQLVDADVRKLLQLTRDFFADRKISYYHRLRHTGYLRHLVVRKAAFTGEMLVNLVTASPDQGTSAGESALTAAEAHSEAQLLTEWTALLCLQTWEGCLKSVLHTRNDRAADVIESQETTVLYGEESFSEKLLGLTFSISAFSFFQTNSAGAELLYGKAREYVSEGLAQKPGATVYDLYSGTGTIAQILAPAAASVIGVEIVEEAVERARINAAHNGLQNCTFLAGDVLKVLEDIPQKPDMIVLDPPRDGVHPKALQRIIRYGVEQILYISCKPTSLARDLVALQEGGYVPQRICCVDLFPWTSGIETVILLSQQRYRQETITFIKRDNVT